MSDFQLAYNRRWRAYVDLLTTVQARGVYASSTSPESLLMPFGFMQIVLVCAWYDEEE